MRLDWSWIADRAVLSFIIAVLGFSGQLITHTLVDEVDCLRREMSEVKDFIRREHAKDAELMFDEPDEPSFTRKTLNWITFKEFRK